MAEPARQRGITLMESLVTLAILGVGLAGAARFQALAMKSSRDVKCRGEAVSLLRDQASRLQHFSTLQQFQQLAKQGRRRLVGTHTTYHLSWTLAKPTPSAQYKLLKINIHWPTAKGPYGEQIETLLSAREPARSGWRLK